MTANQATALDEVVDICRDLIRIDTSNPGDHSGPGERQAAEHVAALLADVGLEPQVLESHPRRTSVVARFEGQDQARPALLVHGHLDVVPAHAPDWKHAPVLRRDRRRLHLGPRRDRHEGHGRDDAGRRPPAAARATPARPRRRARVHRGRGGGRHLGCPLAGGQSSGPVRGRDRGGRRGRRLQPDPRPPAPLSAGDRGEGPGLDAADRARHGRPWLDDPAGQRGHRAGRGDRRGWAGTSGRSACSRPSRPSWKEPPRPSASNLCRTIRALCSAK